MLNAAPLGVRTNMIQVLPKIVVWVFLIGIVYVVFGPQAFDSSNRGNPLNNSSSPLFLPPAKSERLMVYERRLLVGELQPDELAEYEALSREHQGGFWEGKETSVEEALSGVKNNRSEHLASILGERGLSKEEQSIFFTVLKRDQPAVLEDRE